jgi:uncharacterized protein YbjT (DUF2867 family)
MRVLVIGATGALGRDIVAGTLSAGHQTAALVRDPGRTAALPAGVQAIQGDVLRIGSLVTAVSGTDAVICALGTPSPRRPSTLLRDGTQNLVKAMQQQGPRRLVCVTLLGTGSSRDSASFVYRTVILRALAPMVPDKEAQEDAVQASGLDWTLVRPPRFAGGRGRGRVRVIAQGQPGRVGHVVRADLSRFVLDCASKDLYVGQAVAVGS